jgi:hypothetical protein
VPLREYKLPPEGRTTNIRLLLPIILIKPPTT